MMKRDFLVHYQRTKTNGVLEVYLESGVVLIYPIGPSCGKEHVIRAFNGKRGRFDRSNRIDEDDAYLGLIRLVIKAKDTK